jgi:hypothetical protein
MDLHALVSIPGSSEMAVIFQEVVSAYGLQISPTAADPITTRSDHSSFWRLGYPAILITEDMDDFNPNYHSADDLLENIQDLDYYAEMIKASLGTLAHMGCLVEDGWGTVKGVVTDQTTRLPIPGAAVSLSNPEWGYTFNTRTDQGGNYQFSALQGWHNLTADDLGYGIDSSQVFINQNQSITVNLELMPANETVIYLPLAGNGLPIPQPGCP